MSAVTSFAGFAHADGVATPEMLDAAERDLGIRLPDDYRDLVLTHGTGEAWVGSHFLRLWKVADLARDNREYGFPEHAPSLVAFGSDGGGEAFAFDTRTAPMAIVVVPFIGMGEDAAIPVAKDVTHLLSRMAAEATLFQP